MSNLIIYKYKNIDIEKPMNLNIGIIIKGFLAISITLFIVIGIIRQVITYFMLNQWNPPSKDELFANIDFIDESYFLKLLNLIMKSK